MGCKKHLSQCVCPDVTERLRKLIDSPHVYVGNIIEARIAAGLNSRDDFEGNIHAPFAGPVRP
jgi:hypothetical protein